MHLAPTARGGEGGGFERDGILSSREGGGLEAQIANLPGKQEHGEVPDVTRDLISLIALSFIPRNGEDLHRLKDAYLLFRKAL